MWHLIHAFFRSPPDLDYHKYLQSEEWKAKRARARERYYNRCQVCNVSGFARQLHTHHKTYERVGNELMKDLTLLCERCHEIFHQHGDGVGVKPRLSRDEFLVVLRHNGVTPTNTDPWHRYERGKSIIQHILDGLDAELYDYYNRINIEVLDAALEFRDRREAANGHY